MARKIESDLTERMKIQETALLDLADSLKRHEAMLDVEMQDVLEELRAIKIYLSRSMPDFKGQFPDIRKKLKAA
jgi:hypothetical protein